MLTIALIVTTVGVLNLLSIVHAYFAMTQSLRWYDNSRVISCGLDRSPAVPHWIL